MDPCEMGVTDVEGGRGPTHGSTKCPAVDRALLQHLIHCEHLLMVSYFLGRGEWGEQGELMVIVGHELMVRVR